METNTFKDLEKVYIRSREDVLFQVLEDDVVLLDTASGEYFGLNEVGALIWVLSQKGRNLGSILGEIIERYEVTEDELIAHVTPFLDELESEGLISRVKEA